MNEFARVLDEILKEGKQKKLFTVKALAAQAGIAASYLSNLRQAKQKPPTHKTLHKLRDAFLKLDVPDTEVQRIIDAYHRELFGTQQEGGLLILLAEACTNAWKDLRQEKPLTRSDLKSLLHTDFVEGDVQTLLKKTIHLLDIAARMEQYTGRIYLTCFHHSFEARHTLDEPQQKHLKTLIRYLLSDHSRCQVLHLWSGNVAKGQSVNVIVNFLTYYIGTSNCFLYQVRHVQHVPEYVVIENIGFIEARPISEDRYWIRTVLLDDNERKQPPNELTTVVAYLEYLLGPETSRQLLVHMEAASVQDFYFGKRIKNIAGAEKHCILEERLVIKRSLSAVYWPEEAICRRLRALQVPDTIITSFKENHNGRINALAERLQHQKDKCISEKHFLQQQFNKFLMKDFSAQKDNDALRQAESDLLKAQIVEVLRAIQQNPNAHLALSDQESYISLNIAGNIALLDFCLPGSDLIFEPDEQQAAIWTGHPDVVYRLRNEFEAMWQAIDPNWRTDNKKGRRHVVNFLVVESLKAMLKGNVPGHEFQTFASELVEVATYFDFETYIKELYTQEQAAKEIWQVCYDFPIMTMPTHICPWDPKSPLRTRQHLLSALLYQLESFHLITTQAGIEKYWETGQFGSQTFLRKESTEQHFQYVHDLLLESPQNFTMEILPAPEELLVDFQVIDKKVVCIQKVYEFDEKGGIMLQDEELAQELIDYFERKLSAKCPEHPPTPLKGGFVKGTKNVAKWFEERFGAARRRQQVADRKVARS